MERLRPPAVDTDLLELGEHKYPEPQRVAVSRRGMIATAHHRATEAGVEILESGGNAFDAAVAAAFALGVCEPAASGLGGQTMVLLRDAASGKTLALDGSSRAPNRATPKLLSNRSRRLGHTASTVPSTPAVLRLRPRAPRQAEARPRPQTRHSPRRNRLRSQRLATCSGPPRTQGAQVRRCRPLYASRWRSPVSPRCRPSATRSRRDSPPHRPPRR